jgi:hypothetical protein
VVDEFCSASGNEAVTAATSADGIGAQAIRMMRPLMEAVDYAESALPSDPWAMMMQWNQAGLLPMRGKADGVTRDFQCHWFDFLVQWGSDEPAPPPPANETVPWPLVGPGRTTSRPRRSALAPNIADRIEAPSPLRLHGSDDILWFDQVAARTRGVDVPATVSNVLVDMTALRWLIREWQSGDARTAQAHLPTYAPVPVDWKAPVYNLVTDKLAATPRTRPTKRDVPFERVLAWMTARGVEAVARGERLERNPTIDAAVAPAGLNCSRAAAREAWGSVPDEMRRQRGRPPKSAADNGH